MSNDSKVVYDTGRVLFMYACYQSEVNSNLLNNLKESYVETNRDLMFCGFVDEYSRIADVDAEANNIPLLQLFDRTLRSVLNT